MKKNRLLTFILALCLCVTGALLLVGCGDKADNTPGSPTAPTVPDKSDAAALQAVAGTYSNTWYESEGKITRTLEVTTGKKWTMTTITENGLNTETVESSGTFEINAAKQLTEFKFDDFAASQQAIEKFAGVTLPAGKAGGCSLDEVAAIEEMYKAAIDIYDGYLLVMVEGDYGYCLYKSGVQKLAVGTVIRTFTEKEFQEYAGPFTSETYPFYESDYYVEKLSGGTTPTEAAQKEAFLNTIELGAFELYENDIVILHEIAVTDVTAVDLTTAGKRNATLTYKNGTADATRAVTYTVVNSEADLPENAIEEIYVIDRTQSTVSFQAVAKNTALYDLQWILAYRTWEEVQDDDSPRYLSISVEFASGEDAIITVSGYDPSATGLQTVTFTYRGKSVQVVVFVYDETVNPVVRVEADGFVTIVKDGDDYTVIYEGITAKAYKFGDSTGTAITLNEANIVNLRDLSTYEDGDTIIFKYETEFGGNTYTFYVEIEVEIVDAA